MPPFEGTPAEADPRSAILGLIGSPMYPYLITTTQGGWPYSRPVICVNDGFDVSMVTRRAAIKVRHLRRQPIASVLWVDVSGGTPARSVLLRGKMTIVDDLTAVEEFASRYAVKNAGRRRPWDAAQNRDRVVLRLSPDFCRADWFAGFHPVILRGPDLRWRAG